MVDLREFVSEIMSRAPASEKNNVQDIVAFFVDNEWFGDKPVLENGKVMLTDAQIKAFSGPLQTFLAEEGTSEVLLQKLTVQFPATAEQLKCFLKEESLPEATRFYLIDFLLYRLNKELALYTDGEVTGLLKHATMDMLKEHGDWLTFFMAWLRATGKTRFQRDYLMEKRYTMEIQSKAYDFSEYLELLYYLFNSDYIEDNEMYQKAAVSKNYTDTWLYLSMHFICSLRYTDLTRIYHPDLHYPPEEILQKINDDTFSENDAKMVLLSITTRMCLLPFAPNKTDASQGIAAVKFHIPSSCESHFGKLFALAEAHRQINGCAEEPVVRRIRGYEEITRYMGEEIGNLFLESDFRSRSATKSYLQSIYMLADDILEETTDGPSVKGYMLAALARSHKGAYGEFAATTFEYLKDAKLSGLTPEFVAFELLERGVLSFVSSTLLKMVTEEEYSKLSVQNQTKMIKALNLSPREIESVVSVMDSGKRQAQMVIKEVVASDVDVLTALHRIGSGQAFSKGPDCLCLLTALERICPYDNKRQCIGCKYEISTKSTFYLMIGEYNRFRKLYKTATSPEEKAKYKQLTQNIILPKLDEMLCCIRESYGEEVFSDYEELLRGFVQ